MSFNDFKGHCAAKAKELVLFAHNAAVEFWRGSAVETPNEHGVQIRKANGSEFIVRIECDGRAARGHARIKNFIGAAIDQTSLRQRADEKASRERGGARVTQIETSVTSCEEVSVTFNALIGTYSQQRWHGR